MGRRTVARSIQWRGVVVGLLGLLASDAAWAVDKRPVLVLSATVHETATEPFVEHLGKDGGGRYLTLTVPFAPVRALREALESRLEGTLRHRGEAHITTLTPSEFEVIAPFVTIEQVHVLARAAEIQGAPFEVRCLGRGVAEVEGSTEHTYFVVVRSAELRALRRQIHDAYLNAGGPPSLFDPAAWDAHITVGFTRRDLHAQDGVGKAEGACWADLVPRAQAAAVK